MAAAKKTKAKAPKEKATRPKPAKATKPKPAKATKPKPAKAAKMKPAKAAKVKPAKAAKPKLASIERAKQLPSGEWPSNDSYERGCELLHDDPKAAIKLFQASAKLQPKRARIYINLAWALSNLARHAEAKAAAAEAHALDPTDPYVAAMRVHVLFTAKDDRLVEVARAALEKPELDAEQRFQVHGALCWTLMRTAPAAAVEETERLVADSPNNAEALAARGCALAAVCRWDEGIAWLDKAIAAAPDDHRFPDRRATIEQARAIGTETVRSLQENVEQRPDDAKAWRELGLGLAKVARLEEALDAFERANEIDPVKPGKKLSPLVQAALMVEATAHPYVAFGMIQPIG
jgi:tetratricopeptide (TPR) repeat protein